MSVKIEAPRFGKQKILDLVESITQLPGSEGGMGLGGHVLNLYMGILGGTLAQKFMVGDKGNVIAQIYKDEKLVHLFMLMLIAQNVITWSRFEEDVPKTLVATAAIYLWFNLSINTKPFYVLVMLAALVLASMIYRIRRSPGLVDSPENLAMLKNVELGLYTAAMAVTVFGYFDTTSESTSLDDLGMYKYIWKLFPFLPKISAKPKTTFPMPKGFGLSDYTTTTSFGTTTSL